MDLISRVKIHELVLKTEFEIETLNKGKQELEDNYKELYPFLIEQLQEKAKKYNRFLYIKEGFSRDIFIDKIDGDKRKHLTHISHYEASSIEDFVQKLLYRIIH